MIKSNLPIPYLYRLRLRDRVKSAADRTVIGGETRAHVQSSRCRRNPLGRRAARPRASEPFLNDFIREYERFTGVLCAAAMSGCGPRCEQEYVRARRWFIGHYYRIASRLRPYLMDLAMSPNPTEAVVILDYAGQPRSVDPLEELFVSRTLKDLLDSDDGTLLPRMETLSDAVYRCMSDMEKE